MRHTLVLFCFVVAVSFVIGFAATIAQSQPGAKALVELQTTTPGSAQSGHANLTGTVKAGLFEGGGAGLTDVDADLLDGLDSTAFLQSVPLPLTLNGTNNGPIITAINAQVGGNAVGVLGRSTATIGTAWGVVGECFGTTAVGVSGRAYSASGGCYGGYFQTDSSGGIGAVGYASSTTGTTWGLFGHSLTQSGRGVYGFNGSATGSAVGVYGQTISAAGVGVYGLASSSTGVVNGVEGGTPSTSGRAVFGNASASSGTTYGVYGTVASPSGTGVFGIANVGSGSAVGVYGRTMSTSGTGVLGEAASSTGSTQGVAGLTSSPAGIGVLGHALSLTGICVGLYGRSDSTAGVAVYGLATATSGTTNGLEGASSSTSGRGVYGLASAGSGTTYGVLGNSLSPAASAFSVYAMGKLGAGGSKAFRIDHPDDPENRYLMHYSTESPEVLNAYSGTVRLDENGEAVVTLPGYFGKINKDPRYTLTAVGAPMPNLHVAEEIGERALETGSQTGPGQTAPVCRFRIAGGKAGAKVSWRVEAVRNDLWIRRYGSPVEVEKDDEERGKLQHPELYGEPAERGIAYRPPRPQAAAKSR